MVAKACINGTREHSRSYSTSGANEHTITIYYSFLGRIEVCPPPKKWHLNTDSVLFARLTDVPNRDHTML